MGTLDSSGATLMRTDGRKTTLSLTLMSCVWRGEAKVWPYPTPSAPQPTAASAKPIASRRPRTLEHHLEPGRRAGEVHQHRRLDELVVPVFAQGVESPDRPTAAHRDVAAERRRHLQVDAAAGGDALGFA